jgi:mxaA protein
VKRAICLVALMLTLSSPAEALANDGAPVGTEAAPTATASPAEPVAKTTSAPRAITSATVEQPRLTGYFVGDLLTQRVLLQRDGQTLTPTTLPPIGRVSSWFERHRVTIATDGSLHHWLVIEYQILNAPPKLTNVTLPAWELTVASNSGAPPLTLRVPSASINVAPLSLPGSPEQVGTRDLRPDRLPAVIPTAPIQRAIALSASALALTLIAWIGWLVWRNRRAVATQPFARALREMRALDGHEPGAWQALHRAFDRTAGRAIQSATLPVLFERAPQLAPARTQIETFFAQSSLLFFGSATISNTSLPRTLCAELLRIERRHER